MLSAMNKTSPIQVTEYTFTGYPVTDMARARGFYEGLLNLKETTAFEHEGKAWVEYDVGGATRAISNMQTEQWKPSSDGPAMAFEVVDFEGAVATLKEAGVKFFMEPFDSGVGQMGILSDPDGNTVLIHNRKAQQG